MALLQSQLLVKIFHNNICVWELSINTHFWGGLSVGINSQLFPEFKNGWFPSSHHFVRNIFYQIFCANIVLGIRIVEPTWHLPQHPSSHPTLRSKPFKFILKLYSDIKVEQTKNLSHALLEFFCCI